MSADLPQTPCWWSHKQKCRLAADLPEGVRTLFLR